jgi:uncharacterized RDD family membrane protein YckC
MIKDNKLRFFKQYKRNMSDDKTMKEKPVIVKFQTAQIVLRVKAFLVDMFMIMMPIMYICVYVFLDGKDSFQENQISKWLIMAIFGFIVVMFWTFKGQTPGLKAYNLKVVQINSGEKPSLKVSIIRYVLFLLVATTLILMLVPFFRKDGMSLYDLWSKCQVIVDKESVL